MTPLSGLGFAFSGLIVSGLACLLIVLTKPLHSKITLDRPDGIQKVHSAPTPRIGGVGLALGFLASWALLDGEARLLLGALGIAGIPALGFGLAEDFTKAIGVGVRMTAALFSGVVFCLVSGYSIVSVGLWWFDPLLTNTLFAIAFTAFAIGTATNAVNLIDGFHGLASGTVLIMSATIAGVAWSVGDPVLFQVAAAITAITGGFMCLNFPFGKIFLGDGGAYFLGFLVSALTVILPARNPEVSPWISPLILSYPLTETVVSIARRIRGEGQHPGEADDRHLHHLIFGMVSRARSRRPGSDALNHAFTSLILWLFPLVSLIMVVASGLQAYVAIRSTAALFIAYLLLYKIAARSARKSRS